MVMFPSNISFPSAQPLPFEFIKIFAYGNGSTQCLVDHQLHIKEQGHKILIKSLTTVFFIYYS